MALRYRNSAVLAVLEATPGTDNSPSPSTNAIECENAKWTATPNVIQTNEHTGSLDGAGPIIAGMKCTLTFDTYLKGSSAAGTPPQDGVLFKASGYSEVITATAVPAAPEAVGTGSSTTTVKLGATATGTAELYRGMPLQLSGDMTNLTFIADYTAAKLAAITDTLGGVPAVGTTLYQILKNVLYMPATASLPTATIWIYTDGELRKFTGCTGKFALKGDAGGIMKITWTFEGLFESFIDAAVPAATFDPTRPAPWLAGSSGIGAFLVNLIATAASALTLDSGNTVDYPDDPNQVTGYAPPTIFDRRIVGTIDPNVVAVGTRNVMADLLAGTRRVIHARLGPAAAGQRCAITVPAAQFTKRDDLNRKGVFAETVAFEAVGQNAGAAFCFF